MGSALLRVKILARRLRSSAQKLFDICDDLFFIFRPRLALCRPAPTGMQNIPPRSHPLVSSTPRVVIAEAIDDGVPDGRELRYQERLPQGDPYVVNNQKTTKEVL